MSFIGHDGPRLVPAMRREAPRAYIDRMSDHCGSCRFDPKVRVGDDACPFTAGYWWFLDRHRETFAGNHRMSRAVKGLDRLTDLGWLVEQDDARGNRAP